MYRVEVDAAPAYELMVSLAAFGASRDHKTLDLGPAWVARVQERLGPEVAALTAAHELPWWPLLDPLIWQCPGARDAASLLRWLASLSAGELYELLAPYASECTGAMFRDLGGARDECLRVLSLWNERYFQDVDPAILTGLQADAAAKRRLREALSPQELVEMATMGVVLAPAPGLETVLLVPQYHYRPWNINSKHGGTRVILYPADVLSSAPGEPPPALLRLTGALADGNRLRILRFLAHESHSFTEVVQETGLAKSTVHHHMVALRAAGLVRVHDAGDGATSYSLRPDAIDGLGRRLGAFLAD